MSKIVKIVGREIINSRGHPTIEAEIHLNDGAIGLASVPSGSSVGSHEVIEIRDNNKNRFLGKGMLTAVDIINTQIAPMLIGKNAKKQMHIDEIMINLDGTKNKSKLGGNSILAVSLATAKAAAMSKRQPLYLHIAELYNLDNDLSLPLPMINIINGGKHADNNIDIQEFMIIPVIANSIKEAIRIGAEIFHNLANILKKYNMSIAVGDEGGYAPNIASNYDIFNIIQEAIEKSKYILGKDIFLAIDCAASELLDITSNKYVLKNENKSFTSYEFTNYLKELTERYPIISIEDGLSELDWDGFIYQTQILGNKVQLVGDDLFSTNIKILKKGIAQGVVNAILIKLNQIGTLTETLETIKIAKKSGYATIISHRSGDTEDTTIADLAVGTAAGQIKTGSMSRSERTAKYNQLLRIEESLGNQAIFNSIKEIKIHK